MKLLKKQNKDSLSGLSDNVLVVKYKTKNETECIGELYKRYSHIVFGVSLKYLKNTEKAQDALLDIFNKLFDLLKKYKIDDFKSWLLAITRNYCIKELKESKNKVSLEPMYEKNYSQDFMENEQEITHLIRKEEQLQKLEEALQKLKPEQKICVSKFYLEEKSYQDIVEETGFELKKVKSYIQNGKRNLQIIIQKNRQCLR